MFPPTCGTVSPSICILLRACLCVSEDPEIRSAASKTTLCLAERVFTSSEDWDGSQLIFFIKYFLGYFSVLDKCSLIGIII